MTEANAVQQREWAHQDAVDALADLLADKAERIVKQRWMCPPEEAGPDALEEILSACPADVDIHVWTWLVHQAQWAFQDLVLVRRNEQDKPYASIGRMSAVVAGILGRCSFDGPPRRYLSQHEWAQLTNEERKVVRHFVEDRLSQPEIASVLHREPCTVRDQLRSARDKLNLDDLSDLRLLALPPP